MDAQSYCDTVSKELVGWKAQIYDAISRTDRLPTGAKDQMLPNIQDIHIIVNEMEERLDTLRNECPADWSSENEEAYAQSVRDKLKGALVNLEGKLDKYMEGFQV
ncbi:hypothetical protein SAMN02745216_04015 [Desulfatibacillum alkenivorans DSM 16219]|jgi:hypothetical protein|uniref:Uncharacterized protein n=1 Tax=Desulfatibacillum alkenivorans DSM 16219 TaxID=1121393 RepID=A0A1M6UZ36_9BACT|nr:hypothetical protein [Desulfatibacillum alkenivorans]SHK74440.1 hypothetical protein SAMN02745216_04015 [Desulfatibacillum alkenivorans DSM 16219]